MKAFIAQHAEKINGVLHCFDRVILRGHLPMAGVGYFLAWLSSKRIALNLKEPPEGWWTFKAAAPWFAEKIKAHAQTLAAQAGRPYQHLSAHDQRMEENARALADKDGIRDGLVCVYGTMETCRTFRVRFHERGPELAKDQRVSLVIYFYYLDRAWVVAREDSDLVSLHDAGVRQRPRMAGTQAHGPGDRLSESGQCLCLAARSAAGAGPHPGLLASGLAEVPGAFGGARQSAPRGLARGPELLLGDGSSGVFERCSLRGQSGPRNLTPAFVRRSRDPVKALQETLTVPIVEVPPDDLVMEQAVAKARQDWPRFVAAYETGAGQPRREHGVYLDLRHCP